MFSPSSNETSIEKVPSSATSASSAPTLTVAVAGATLPVIVTAFAAVVLALAFTSLSTGASAGSNIPNDSPNTTLSIVSACLC